MFKLRMIGRILRQAKLGHITIVFLVIYALCALVVSLAYPGIGDYGDALWLCFQTVTTIGFGDMPTDNLVVRIAIVALSIVSIFYLAIITGVVVAYCIEMTKAQADESVAKFVDDLEHLDEKTPEELHEISERIAMHRGEQRVFSRVLWGNDQTIESPSDEPDLQS